MLGPGFAPYGSSAFYMLELSSKKRKKKHFKNAHCEFYEQFFTSETHVAHTKPFNRKKSLSESREGSRQELFLVQCKALFSVCFHPEILLPWERGVTSEAS